MDEPLFTGLWVDIEPDTDPASVPALLAELPVTSVIQFWEPLPARLLAALADELRRYPDMGLRAYMGWDLDPSLAFLRGFEHVRRLFIEVWHAESFEPLAPFVDLVELRLGQTRSARPSLGVLRNFPKLRQLFIEGHSRDFEAVAHLEQLSRLGLGASRVKSLECLSGHRSLESLSLLLGGMRDLTPLPTMPRLRELVILRVRLLSTDDLLPLSEIEGLVALKLHSLRNVASLDALGACASLRVLELQSLSAMRTFDPLARCVRLRHLCAARSRPLDGRLSPLLECPELDEVAVGGTKRWPDEEITSFLNSFKGSTFWHHGDLLKGDGSYGWDWDFRSRVQEATRVRGG